MTDLVTPFARGRLRRLQAALDAGPRPADAGRQLAAGPDPDRVLVLGEGAAMGYGVPTQDLALPGRLAAQLRAATGRGAAVDVVAEPGLSVSAAARLLARTRPEHYDAIVLTVGTTGAHGLLAPALWHDGLETLLTSVRAVSTPWTEIVLVSALPLQDGADGARGPARAHAEQLDRIAEELCRDLDRTSFLPSAGAAARDTAGYTALAARIAAPLAARLDALAEHPPGQSPRRLRGSADPELLRQAALDRTGLLESGPNPRLVELVQHACALFGAPAAAVTLMDGAHLVVKASHGVDSDRFPRSLTPCNIAIRRAAPYVVPDLRDEPGGLLGWRFYAGHPIESPDGFRIGSFCVFDAVPRAGIDEDALATLAVAVQTELWAEIGRAPRDRTVRRRPRALR